MSAQDSLAPDTPVENPAPTGPDYREILYNGIWKNNPALVQLLGLCPLLAVTGTVINGLGLGLATLLTLVLSNAV
ncbi:MAG: electron transport complex subunit RsxE, partial [Marinomonas sp.]